MKMRKETYLARVIKADNNWYAIDFPDLPGTHAQCKRLEDIQQEAENSLCSFLLAAEAVGEEVAPPSPMLVLNDGEMAVIVVADLERYERTHNTKSVRKTVSIPMWMAEKADREGWSLSKVLQDSLEEKLAMI